MKWVVGLAVVMLVGLSASAVARNNSPAVLLELGSDARALGMGGAFVSLAGEATTLLYNPAGLAYVNDQSVSGYVARPFGAFDHLAFGYAGPNLGASLLQMGVATVAQTNEFGNPTGQSLDYVSRAAVAGFGYEIFDGLAFGAQFKGYFEENGPVRGFGWALDPALLYTSGALKLGAVFKNAVSEAIVYDNGQQAPWFTQWVLGGSWSLQLPSEMALVLAVDVEGLGQDEVRPHLGGELWIDNLALRLGWDAGMLTAGASVLYGNLQVHWAYAFHDTLPETLRLSATVSY